MSDETVLKAVERIESRMDRLWHIVTLDKDRLWDTADVAAYLGVSEAQVRRLAQKNETFPLALRSETGDQVSQPRWAPEEIKAWIRRPEHQVSRAS